jgi:hypothetical protein
MPYEKVLEETMRRCELYLKAQGKRRAGRGNVGKVRNGERPYTFDDLVSELLEKAGF